MVVREPKQFRRSFPSSKWQLRTTWLQLSHGWDNIEDDVWWCKDSIAKSYDSKNIEALFDCKPIRAVFYFRSHKIKRPSFLNTSQVPEKWSSLLKSYSEAEDCWTPFEHSHDSGLMVVREVLVSQEEDEESDISETEFAGFLLCCEDSDIDSETADT